MKQEQFEQSCKNWLSKYNYKIHSKSGNGLSLIFTDFDEPNKPSIYCNLKDEKIEVELKSMQNFKLGLSLCSGPIQFNHPNIKLWIKTMTYYEDLIEQFPPN